MAGRGFDIAGVGMAVYDVVMLAAAYPAEDSKTYAESSFTQGGGPCATALAAASRLGARTAFAGALGDDAFGRAILADFADFGVDTSGVRVQAGATSHASTVLSSAQSRTVVTARGTAGPLLPSELPEEIITGAEILHLDAHEMDAALAAARMAKAAGVIVSLDAGSPYPGIEALLPLADILVPSESFVRRCCGEDIDAGAAALYARCRPRLFAVTQGERGGIYYDSAGVPRRFAAFPVKAVDTNGAGDVFHGALLAALLQGDAAEDALRFASAAAALTCQVPGARGSVPTRQAVLDFINTRCRFDN